ncbi:MAG TPA: hypothetical protein DE036_06280 [Actinobacteria bacterium]|nr:hypothetical protein [Actinomycetota bacterium]
MDSLINDYLSGFFESHEPPCLSLYQPTHRYQPESSQDLIRFRNLLKVMEESLRQRYPTREVQPLLEPFQALAEDHDFWSHTLEGLAVLGSPGMFRAYRLQRQVGELVVVADSLHTKPLMRIVQSADRYQVLGLNRHEVRLFEGNRDALDEFEPAKGVPRTLTEALGEELTEPQQTVASYGTGGAEPATYHGHSAKQDEVDIDAERFFRVVDHAVLEHHSRPSGLPLLLAALPESSSLFRQVSRNPFLLAEGIDIHTGALPIDELRDLAWRAVEPHYLARLGALVDAFGEAISKGLGADELAVVGEAAVAGRVATLLIEAERQVPGRLDAKTGRIDFDELVNPGVDDLLDDLGELVLKMGGQVVVVPAEKMPALTGLAAIYRF